MQGVSGRFATEPTDSNPSPEANILSSLAFFKGGCPRSQAFLGKEEIPGKEKFNTRSKKTRERNPLRVTGPDGKKEVSQWAS